MDKRVLVIDDDVMNLRMAEFILKQNGYNVLKADSGSDGLKLLKTETVNLVLLDMEMPVMGGLEVLEAMKETEEFCPVPVIILTGTIESESVEKAVGMGAKDCISKPFIPQDFLHRIEKIIG